MSYKKIIEEFAKKLVRVPREIRAMSGVPSDVKKAAGDE